MAERTYLARRLAEYVTGLDASDPKSRGSQAAVDALADARIVGLGEATHGTYEFFELRRRIVEHLVTELDYRLFGLEANFTETLAIDDYVVHGKGDPRTALEGLGLWPWNVEEMLALVEWLREFNVDRAAEDRVRFYGFDIQFVESAASAVREYLSGVDSDALAVVDDDLRLLESKDVRGERYGVAEEHLDSVETTVAALVDRFDRRGDEYAVKTSQAAFNLVRQHPPNDRTGYRVRERQSRGRQAARSGEPARRTHGRDRRVDPGLRGYQPDRALGAQRSPLQRRNRGRPLGGVHADG